MRPQGVADAHVVENPQPPKDLSKGTPLMGRCWALVAPADALRRARKALCISKAPVPQTDTGRQEEDSKANGRMVVKELGKLTP